MGVEPGRPTGVVGASVGVGVGAAVVGSADGVAEGVGEGAEEVGARPFSPAEGDGDGMLLPAGPPTEGLTSVLGVEVGLDV